MLLVGRNEELTGLDGLLAAASDGHGTSVLVHGEAGIGKSTVLAALRERATAAGFRVLTCQGTRGGGGAGFEGLHELLFPLLDGLDSLPPRQRSALGVPFGLEDGVPANRLITGLATFGLIEEASLDGPLLLVIEDLHWLDLSTADVVTLVAGRLGSVPVLLIATSRAEAVYPDRTQYFEHNIALAPLSEPDAHELLSQKAPELNARQRRRLITQANGNPLALTEWSTDTTWLEHATDGEGARAPLGRRLEQSFRSEVSLLPASTQRALLVAAAGDDLSIGEVVEAAEQVGLAERDFLPAQRFGLISVRDDVLSFRHPLVSSAVYDSADPDARARVHAALAKVARDPARAVRHRAAAIVGWDEEVAAQLEDHATNASRRGARTEAAAAWRRAAALTPAAADRANRTIMAAEAARQAGLTSDSATLVAEAALITWTPDAKLRLARTDWMLAGTSLHEGISGRDLIALSRTTATATERLEVLVWAATRCYLGQERDPDVAAAIGDELATVAQFQPGAEQTFRDIAVALIEPTRPVPDVDVALDYFRRQERETDAILLNSLAFTVEDTFDLAAAAKVWSTEVDLFHRSARTPDEIIAISGRGTARVTFTQLTEGLTDSAQALRVAPDLGLAVVGALGAVNVARVRAWRGETEAARQALSECYELSGGTPVARIAALASWAEASLAAQEGQFEAAVQHLRGTLTHPPIGLWAGADLAEYATRVGQVAVVDEWLDMATSVAARSSHLSMLVERSRALVSGGDSARDAFQAAIEFGLRTGATLDLAKTRLFFAEWLRRERRLVEAREQLSPALAVFREQQVQPLISRAEAEFRAAGGAEGSRRARLDAVSLLSAQELHVARLAAAGLTNQQIADQIYLSHRTVGSHLHRVYSKLGVGRRSELAGALKG